MENKKMLEEIENLREENKALKEEVCKYREIINKYEKIVESDDKAYYELELLYEELRLDFCAVCEESMGFKVDYVSEKEFHIDYGDITPAIARHLLNSKTLKEIANKERI